MKTKKITTLSKTKEKANLVMWKARRMMLMLSVAVGTLLMSSARVYASTVTETEEAVDADTMWNNIINFLLPWVCRAGGAIALVGAIIFFLGWRRDDPEQKTTGTNTVIAGCGIFAVGLSGNIFLA